MREFLGLPLAASAHAPEIDNVIVIVHWLMFILFVGWTSFFLFTVFRFRQSRSPAANYSGAKTHLSTYLEGAVAVFEIALIAVFAVPLWYQRVEKFPPEKESTVIRVVGEQFAWNVHYSGPDGIFGRTDINLISAENPLGIDRTDPNAKDDIITLNNLYLPVNKPVIIYLTTKDVIHSFGLPLLRVKQDAIPGERIPIWFIPTMTVSEVRDRLSKRYSLAGGTPPAELFTRVAMVDYKDKAGNPILNKGDLVTQELITRLLEARITEIFAAPDTPVEIACSQLCGLGHYKMRGTLAILTEEDYQKWMQQELAALQPETPATETQPKK